MRLYVAAAGAAMLALIGGSVFMAFVWPSGDDRFAQCRGSTVSGGAGEIGGPFTLVDETGKTVTDADVITKPTLVYFGYTFCPDVCPLDAFRNGEAVDLLAARGYDVGSIFISIDPARDTPEQLAFFTDGMHPDMIGLTGTEEQVKAASRAYKTYYRKQDSEDEYYLVDHSTFTYLVDPEAGFLDFFRRDDSAEAIAERVQCFMDAT